LFSGGYLAPELANQVSRHQMLAHAQAEHEKAQTAQSQTLLLSHGQIEKVYSSRGKILLTPQRYKKIVAHHVGMEEERVHPDEIPQGKRALSDKLNRLKSNLLISGEMTVEDSDYEYYSPTVTSRDDRSEADIMMTLSEGHRQSLGRFVDENTQSLTASLEMKGRHRAPVALGDFNGDGRPDIGYFSPEGLFFLFADENGAYGPVKKMATKNTFYHGPYATHVRHLVGDINGDGLDDIMFFLDSRDPVQILLGQPTEDFVFKTIKDVKLPSLSQAAPVLTDVNGDGHPDWVSLVKNRLYVHYGDEAGMLGVPEEVSHPDDPLRSAQYLHHLSGDINGDGLGDILSVTRDGQLETRLGSRTPGQPLRRLANQTQGAVKGFGGVFNPSQLQLHDMNGDGRSDLVVIQDDGSYTMSYGQAEGTLGEASDDKSREEQGAKVAYRPNLLARQNEQKIVGIRQGAVHLELISLNEQGEVHAHPFESRRESDLIAYYKLGDGEDEMTGQPSRRNYFDVGGGTKKFTGGSCADTFLLQGHQAPGQPGHFNGAGPVRAEEGEKDDQDTVIAAVRPANGRGYQIDLQKGEVKYVGEDTRIATLENIEHAIGHRETNDILIGDDRNNHLEGAGGSDTLTGHGGNDILSLSSGTATGGEGIDSYRILQNTRAAETLTEIEVKETVGQHETRNIILDYDAANVMSLSLKDTESGGDMVLTLRNDNQSLTEVRFKNMYGLAQGKTRFLQHHYFLYTRDGMFITGFPETLMQQADGRWPVPPLILDNFHQKGLLMGTGMAHHYVVEHAFLKRDIVIHRQVMPHDKDAPVIQDRLEVPWLLQETVLTTDKDDVVLSPVGDTHASVRIKHFIKEAPDRPLSLVDLNGDVAPVEVNEEGLVSIGRPEGTDENDTVMAGHDSDLKDNRLNLEAESPGPVSKVLESDLTAGRLPESMAGFASSQSDSLASQAEPLHRHWNPLNPAAGQVAHTVVHA
ncbi:FG-GAP-like repeat-containing protein, partial [Candidatus Williamhamiltonella defendens]